MSSSLAMSAGADGVQIGDRYRAVVGVEVGVYRPGAARGPVDGDQIVVVFALPVYVVRCIVAPESRGLRRGDGGVFGIVLAEDQQADLLDAVVDVHLVVGEG